MNAPLIGPPAADAFARRMRAAGIESPMRSTGTAVGANNSGRLISYIFSDSSVGRDNHVIKAGAWDTGNFARNPVFLWAHDQSSPPIGKVVDISEVGGKLRGTVEYANADISPFADLVFRLVKGGYLNATSVSWLPREFSYSQDRSRPGGIDFSKVELLEVSQVPVPALPSALVTARAAGIDTRPLFTWAERMLDTRGFAVLPRAELELLRRAARAPARSTGADNPIECRRRKAAARLRKYELELAASDPRAYRVFKARRRLRLLKGGKGT